MFYKIFIYMLLVGMSCVDASQKSAGSTTEGKVLSQEELRKAYDRISKEIDHKLYNKTDKSDRDAFVEYFNSCNFVAAVEYWSLTESQSLKEQEKGTVKRQTFFSLSDNGQKFVVNKVPSQAQGKSPTKASSGKPTGSTTATVSQAIFFG